MGTGRSRVLFAGDIHLHPRHPEVTARFREFLSITVPGATSLHLIGDLFDRWVSPAQAKLPYYADILERLRETAASGVNLTFLPGNRDFLLDGETASRAGLRRLPLWHEIRLGDDYVLVTHGDLLCTRDRPYQRLRAVLRLPFVTWLSRVLPFRGAAAVGDSLRGASTKAVAVKPETVDGLAPEAVRRRFATGRADVMVCGHVHRPGETRMRVAGRERRLFVVPDWFSAAGWVEWVDGMWNVVPGEGREPTDPALLPEASRTSR